MYPVKRCSRYNGIIYFLMINWIICKLKLLLPRNICKNISYTLLQAPLIVRKNFVKYIINNLDITLHGHLFFLLCILYLIFKYYSVPKPKR